MDADGQHDPMVLQAFIEALNDGMELVIGSRDKFQRRSEKIFLLAKKYGVLKILYAV